MSRDSAELTEKLADKFRDAKLVGKDETLRLVEPARVGDGWPITVDLPATRKAADVIKHAWWLVVTCVENATLLGKAGDVNSPGDQELSAAMRNADSPAWSVRAAAGRQLAMWDKIDDVADVIHRLLLDAQDTAVTQGTAEAPACPQGHRWPPLRAAGQKLRGRDLDCGRDSSRFGRQP